MDFKTFWEVKHNARDVFYLTGSNLNEINKYHNILDLNELKQKSLLEIGVGHGNLSNELVDLVDKLICCDISDKALDSVNKKVYSKHLTQNIKNSEPVDFALCHLVLQHCVDEEVSRIIDDVNLKKDGIMSIQVAFLIDPNKGGGPINGDSIHFFRDLNIMEKIVSETNKKIVSVLPPFNFTDQNIGWNVIKLMNK